MQELLGDGLHFLLLPFLMCLILVGIHCYLGFHVLIREVIFVDLSLAQVAAFGSTLALLFGFEHHSIKAYLISLVSTLVAAAIFALSRRYESKFSQEAIIGIVYAMGSAAVVLLVDQMAHGTEHIKHLLVGQLLWVTWPDFIKTSCIYGCVGIIHYVFRDYFLKSSHGQLGKRQGWWDFLFYALFGVVITSSVSIAGVLQVFAFLIVPALVSGLFFVSLKHRLLFGWSLGILLSFVGIIVSYLADFPSGAFIVVCFTVLPILLLLVLPMLSLVRGILFALLSKSPSRE